MELKTATQLVVEFFHFTTQTYATLEDVVTYFQESQNQNDPIELNKARTSIRHALNEFVLLGELSVHLETTDNPLFAPVNDTIKKSPSTTDFEDLFAHTIQYATLYKMQERYKEELLLCAEIQNTYEQFVAIAPDQVKYLTQQKHDAEDRAIQIHKMMESNEHIMNLLEKRRSP